MRGVKELRVKESDRIDAMARGLRAAGVEVEEGPDCDRPGARRRAACGAAAVAETRLDHRIAMSFLCLGMAAKRAMGIDDARPSPPASRGSRR